MPWQQLTITTDQHTAQLISDDLEQLGALSVTMLDAANQPIYEPAPDETRIWTQTRVVGLFEASQDMDSAVQHLRNQPHSDRIIDMQSTELADQDWTNAWLADYRPMQFGDRFWVCASDHQPPDPEATILILDPGLAFGTGTHPTTAMCLRWIASHAGQFDSMIDFGCGSGILAIAAVLLGCDSAIGIDLDPQAVQATADNAQKNAVANRIRVYSDQDYPQDPQPLVVANILAGPLVQLAPMLTRLVQPGGHLVLSGILQEQADAVRQAYSADFESMDCLIEDEWVCLHLRKLSH